ncbi:MAG TPA: hypothetical protein VGD54_19040, partial [Steroidobacteraceae bacterium]
ATAAGPLQVGVTSRGSAAAPARDAGLTGSAAEGAKSAEAAKGHDDCADDGRKDDYSNHAGRDDYSKDKGDYSKRDAGWKGARNADRQPQEDSCDPKPSDACGKGDTYRNPGEALARLDFSHGDFGSHRPDASGDIQGSLRSGPTMRSKSANPTRDSD